MTKKEYQVSTSSAARLANGGIGKTLHGIKPSLHIGKVELTEDELLQLKDIVEFVDRLIREDPKAAALMAAVKAKRRIL